MALGQDRVHLWTLSDFFTPQALQTLSDFFMPQAKNFCPPKISDRKVSCSLETTVVFGVNRQVMTKHHFITILFRDGFQHDIFRGP